MTPFPPLLLKACLIVVIAAPFVVTALAAVAAADLVRGWRGTRAARRQAEDAADVQIASVLALLCTLCRDGGYGRCTCPANCTYPGCTYDHTTFTQLSRKDQDYLNWLEGRHTS